MAGCLLHWTSALCKGLHNNYAETRCTTRAWPVPAGHDRHVGTSKGRKQVARPPAVCLLWAGLNQV